jgi:hypothetical protein
MLTVGQLIAELQTLDPALPAIRHIDGAGVAYIDKVRVGGVYVDGCFKPAAALLSDHQWDDEAISGSALKRRRPALASEPSSAGSPSPSP